jgi:hypothetical protein
MTGTRSFFVALTRIQLCDSPWDSVTVRDLLSWVYDSAFPRALLRLGCAGRVALMSLSCLVRARVTMCSHRVVTCAPLPLQCQIAGLLRAGASLSSGSAFAFAGTASGSPYLPRMRFLKLRRFAGAVRIPLLAGRRHQFRSAHTRQTPWTDFLARSSVPTTTRLSRHDHDWERTARHFGCAWLAPG